MQDCSASFWSATGSCTYIYCSRQAKGAAQAATIMSIPYIISAVLSPFLGGLVDKFGHRAVLCTLAPCMLVIVHILLAFTTVSPVGPLVGQGLAYVIFANAFWPSIPLVIVPEYVGLAYGFMYSTENVGLAVFPLCIAALFEYSGDYIPNVEIFFICLASCGVLIGLGMNYVDIQMGNGVLNAPGNELALKTLGILPVEESTEYKAVDQSDS